MGFFVSALIKHTSNALVAEKMAPLTDSKFVVFDNVHYFF